MIIDNSFIAYEYYKNQYTPKEIYPSGQRDENKLIDKYNFSNKDYPLLIIKDDIVNKSGLGLKRGFYNVCPDKYFDFLLIYQKGDLKAKIPVISVKFYESENTKQQKPQKISYSKYKKQQDKEYRKYLKGENPDLIDYKTVEIRPVKEQNGYLIIYNSNNIELLGLIKL